MMLDMLIKGITELNGFFNCQFFRAALQNGNVLYGGSRIIIYEIPEGVPKRLAPLPEHRPDHPAEE